MAIAHCAESKAILADPGTRVLVHKVLKLCGPRDICDAIADLELAIHVLGEDLSHHLLGSKQTIPSPRGWDRIEVE